MWIWGHMNVILKIVISSTLLSGSCTQLDTAWEAATNEGTVYSCGNDIEYCYYDDASEEVSDITGLNCHEIQYDERVWPWFTNLVNLGCRYSCTATSPGCNA